MNPLFEIESDYEYVLGDIEGKALTMQMHFMDSAPLHEKVNELALVVKETARGIVSAFMDTGNLYQNIDAYPARTATNEITIQIESNAQNNGSYYGGHIEYGYHPRGGSTFVRARPYMRPAIEVAAASTHVNLAAAIAQTFEEVFAYDRFHGLTSTLGTRAARYGQYGRYRDTSGRFLSKQDKKLLGNMSNHLKGNSNLRSIWESSRGRYSYERGKNYIGSRSQGGPSKWSSDGRATSSISDIKHRGI